MELLEGLNKIKISLHSESPFFLLQDEISKTIKEDSKFNLSLSSLSLAHDDDHKMRLIVLMV